MLPPPVAFLRVYQPLSAYDQEYGRRLLAGREHEQLLAAHAGLRERFRWFTAAVSTPSQLLPNWEGQERPVTDLLEVESSAIEATSGNEPGPGLLFCPLDTQERSASGLLDALGERPDVLMRAALPMEPGQARRLGESARAMGRPTQVLQARWQVPLAWFCLIDPEQRRIVLEPRDQRRVYWLASMLDARSRLERAVPLVSEALGEQGPGGHLLEVAEWLDQFDEHSAVELDYGGLVHLLEDEELVGDSSARDIDESLLALADSDPRRAMQCAQKVGTFWRDLAEHRQHN